MRVTEGDYEDPDPTWATEEEINEVYSRSYDWGFLAVHGISNAGFPPPLPQTGENE